MWDNSIIMNAIIKWCAILYDGVPTLNYMCAENKHSDDDCIYWQWHSLKSNSLSSSLPQDPSITLVVVGLYYDAMVTMRSVPIELRTRIIAIIGSFYLTLHCIVALLWVAYCTIDSPFLTWFVQTTVYTFLPIFNSAYSTRSYLMNITKLMFIFISSMQLGESKLYNQRFPGLRAQHWGIISMNPLAVCLQLMEPTIFSSIQW